MTTRDRWVTVGTSEDARESPSLVCRITEMVCEAYGYRRLDECEVLHRLQMGDAGCRANRVLHLAWEKCAGDDAPTLVGCCSSTVQPMWTEYGCGHWGLMVVAPAFQGSGVGSLLVAAAEARLASRKCSQIQIEYEYTSGDPTSERLLAWYEGKCGFICPQSLPAQRGRRQFRRCRKRVIKPVPENDTRRTSPAKKPDAPCPADPPTCKQGLSRVCPRLSQGLWYIASVLVPTGHCPVGSSSTKLSSREEPCKSSTHAAD
ncbi:hypothetical protein AB1Y20_015225 [Prymnesium parvum]|uniref:N-acetyltransferase domain-containing protein n=1 Tax=Prymnesium parvum TaxID=97485 RepID=A0AB34JX76_PRYPA|mmetsp:Transcript_15921/g.39921  ORF Transcript_15921/g.39921 Transcript_15921/m.39921 type:complete len:260 (-) Transcript_15921:220-999(-)